MIKREHIRDDVMFINFAKSLKDVEISALSEIEGELPQKLNRILLDFRFEMRTKESSWKYLEGKMWNLRNFDLAMGYIYFVEQVHILRDSVREDEMQGLDLIIGYTLLANACILLLNFREKLTLGDLLECKVNEETKDIEFSPVVDEVERALLQDPYELYYIGRRDTRVSTLLDSLEFKDCLFNLVALGKPPVYRTDAPLEIRRTKNLNDRGVFDAPMLVSVVGKKWDSILPNIMYFKVRSVELYGMKHLHLEVKDCNMREYVLNIPQYGEYGYAIGNKIPGFMTALQSIIKRDLEGLDLM